LNHDTIGDIIKIGLALIAAMASGYVAIYVRAIKAETKIEVLREVETKFVGKELCQTQHTALNRELNGLEGKE
jgi:hypothetical protein